MPSIYKYDLNIQSNQANIRTKKRGLGSEASSISSSITTKHIWNAYCLEIWSKHSMDWSQNLEKLKKHRNRTPFYPQNNTNGRGLSNLIKTFKLMILKSDQKKRPRIRGLFPEHVFSHKWMLKWPRVIKSDQDFQNIEATILTKKIDLGSEASSKRTTITTKENWNAECMQVWS
jgi:hypothetical protein